MVCRKGLALGKKNRIRHRFFTVLCKRKLHFLFIESWLVAGFLKIKFHSLILKILKLNKSCPFPLFLVKVHFSCLIFYSIWCSKKVLHSFGKYVVVVFIMWFFFLLFFFILLLLLVAAKRTLFVIFYLFYFIYIYFLLKHFVGIFWKFILMKKVCGAIKSRKIMTIYLCKNSFFFLCGKGKKRENLWTTCFCIYFLLVGKC